MQQALAGSTVNSLNSNFIGIGGCVLITLVHSCLELFHSGLQSGLFRAILRTQLLGLQIPLGRRLDICHAVCHLLLLKIAREITRV